MREMSVRFSIILKQTCCRMARSPLPAIREHQVTPRWLHIYCMRIEKTPINTQRTNPTWWRGRSAYPSLGCIHLSAHVEAKERMHPPPLPSGLRPRGARRGRTAVVARHENEKLRREKQNKKRKETWIKERGRSCRENWWNGDCLLLANGWPAGASVNDTCG